jgi:hypothetical protein
LAELRQGGCIGSMSLARSMVWPTSLGAMTCSRCVVSPGRSGGQRQLLGSCNQPRRPLETSLPLQGRPAGGLRPPPAGNGGAEEEAEVGRT